MFIPLIVLVWAAEGVVELLAEDMSVPSLSKKQTNKQTNINIAPVGLKTPKSTSEKQK